MKKILLDANFLMLPAQFNIDIFEEINRICNFKYRLYTLDKIIEELETIKTSTQKLKYRKAAKLALQLINAKHISIIKTDTEDYADDIILKLKGHIIATQDTALKKRLRLKPAKIITMRQKKHLVIV